jgi:2-methylcitrate dehydratase PrpD
MRIRSDSPRVFEHTKNVIADWAGCGIGGANIESTKMVKSVFLSEPGRHDCTVFCGEKASVEHAAFINGAASHGLEMDDASYDAGGHPAVVILPAAMAMAETVNAKGKDFLLSVHLGLRHDDPGRTRRRAGQLLRARLASDGRLRIFGATVAAAWLLKLDAPKIAHALADRRGLCSGNLECYADGSLTKRLNPANAAMGGVNAARLAAVGYTGPKWVFEGNQWVFQVLYGQPDAGAHAGKPGLQRIPYRDCVLQALRVLPLQSFSDRFLLKIMADTA